MKDPQFELSPLKQRMYHLTCMYFQGIHAGIQSYHAGVEYALKYWDTPEFQAWAKRDKTVIVLNGMDSNSMFNDHYSNAYYEATMQTAQQNLVNKNIPYAVFYEPMANNTMTSIALLVDEQVWDKKNYPDPIVLVTDIPQGMTFDQYYYEKLAELYGDEVAFLRQFLKPWRLAN